MKQKHGKTPKHTSFSKGEREISAHAEASKLPEGLVLSCSKDFFTGILVAQVAEAQRLGMKLGEFAVQVGISHGWLNRLRSGVRPPNTYTLIRASEVLGKSVVAFALDSQAKQDTGFDYAYLLKVQKRDYERAITLRNVSIYAKEVIGMRLSSAKKLRALELILGQIDSGLILHSQGESLRSALLGIYSVKKKALIYKFTPDENKREKLSNSQVAAVRRRKGC